MFWKSVWLYICTDCKINDLCVDRKLNRLHVYLSMFSNIDCSYVSDYIYVFSDTGYKVCMVVFARYNFRPTTKTFSSYLNFVQKMFLYLFKNIKESISVRLQFAN